MIVAHRGEGLARRLTAWAPRAGGMMAARLAEMFLFRFAVCGIVPNRMSR